MSSEEEKRAEPRTAHRTVVIMPYGAGEDLAFERAVLVDCSPNGLCIRFHRPLPLHDSFLVKLKHHRIMVLRYRVKHCRAIHGEYIIGARLADHVHGPNEKPAEPLEVFEALLAS
jgi:hypothetical protein